MLGGRHQLHVSEAHLLAVLGELRGRVGVGEPAIGLGRAAPRAEMHLIDRDRSFAGMLDAARAHPPSIAPAVAVEFVDLAGGPRADFAGEPVGVGLFRFVAARVGADEVLIDFALADVGDKYFPDAGDAAGGHLVGGSIPAVEIAYDEDFAGVRRPDGKADAGRALVLGEMSAELLVTAVVRPFAEQMQIELCEKRRFHVAPTVARYSTARD